MWKQKQNDQLANKLNKQPFKNNSKAYQSQMQQHQQAYDYFNEYGADNDEEWVRLDEEMDENYEPTDADVREYAQFLGMNLDKDKKYFYIAREGLKAPLPEQWQPYQNKLDEQVYYINAETGEKQLEHPCDEFYKKKFEETKLKDQQKQAEQMLKARQEKQDMNEGFMGEDILDSSLNNMGGYNRFGMNNGSFYQEEGDEQMQMKSQIEREILQENEDYEFEQLNKYKEKNLDLENLRKKQQKEYEKSIEKDLKGLRKRVKMEEDARNEKLNERKQDVKMRVQLEVDEEFKNKINLLETKNKNEKNSIEQEFTASNTRQSNRVERDYNDQLEMKKKQLESSRKQRTESQRKHDEQFRDIKNKVNNAANKYLETLIEQNDHKLEEIKQSERDKLQLIETQTTEANKKQQQDKYTEVQEKIRQLKLDVQFKKDQSSRNIEDSKSQLIKEINGKYNLALKQFNDENSQDAIEKSLKKEFEEKKEIQIKELKEKIEIEKMGFNSGQEREKEEILSDVNRNNEQQKKQLKKDGEKRILNIKQEYKTTSNMDEQAFELICIKQSLTNQIEQSKQESYSLQDGNDKLNRQIQQQQQKIQQIIDPIIQQYIGSNPSNKLLIMSININELSNKVDKYAAQLDQKEKLIDQLEQLSKEKKEQLKKRKVDKIEFQKKILLMKEQQKLSKSQKIVDNIKYDELLNQIHHLKSTMREQEENNFREQQRLREDQNNILQQSLLQQEQIQLKLTHQIEQNALLLQQSNSVNTNKQKNNHNLKKSTQEQRLPEISELQSDEVQDVSEYFSHPNKENPPKMKSKSTAQQKTNNRQQNQNSNNSWSQPQISDANNSKKRNWNNILLQERNKLQEMKQLIKQKKGHLKSMQNSLQNDQQRLEQELQLDQSDIKKNVFDSIRKNMSSQIEKLQSEVLSAQQTEMLYTIKDKQLTSIEKLYQEVAEEPSKNFNEETFLQLHKVYKQMELPSPLEPQHIQPQELNNISEAWHRIIQNNQQSVSVLCSAIPEQNEQSQGVIDEIEENNHDQSTNFVNSNPTFFVSNQSDTYDISAALQTLRTKYSIPGNASNLVDAPSRQINQMKKKLANDSNSSFVLYNNWANGFKQELNKQILEGPFSQGKYKTVF